MHARFASRRLWAAIFAGVSAGAAVAAKFTVVFGVGAFPVVSERVLSEMPILRLHYPLPDRSSVNRR